jgi:C-terminal processing protease CtpA/Prc
MDINKKQLIEQLRYLAENDPVQLKEIFDAAINSKSNNLEDPNVAYQTEENKKNNIRQFAEESFKRFDKVYKALS